jgi:catechol 2,3-dioxygenase-like lactoylglutathione lyase family enzyme
VAIEYNPSNCVVSVNVSDYARSLAWYRDVLGFPVSYELVDYGWGELETPFGFTIGLGQSEDVTGGGGRADARGPRHRRRHRAPARA